MYPPVHSLELLLLDAGERLPKRAMSSSKVRGFSASLTSVRVFEVSRAVPEVHPPGGGFRGACRLRAARTGGGALTQRAPEASPWLQRLRVQRRPDASGSNGRRGVRYILPPSRDSAVLAEPGAKNVTIRDAASRAEYAARINRVVDHLERHLDQPLKLEELARIACFSPFHFHRLFRALTGESLYQFILRLRLEKAAAQLVQLRNKKLSPVLVQSSAPSLEWRIRLSPCSLLLERAGLPRYEIALIMALWRK